MAYLAYRLHDNDRAQKLSQVKPRFAHHKADHITHAFNIEDGATMPHPDRIEALGIVTDNAGIEALVVRVNGTHIRPDGELYHCTWSYDPARAPVEWLRDHMRERDKAEPTYRSQHANALMKSAFHPDGTPRESNRATYTAFKIPTPLRTQASLYTNEGTITTPATRNDLTR